MRYAKVDLSGVTFRAAAVLLVSCLWLQASAQADCKGLPAAPARSCAAPVDEARHAASYPAPVAVRQASAQGLLTSSSGPEVETFRDAVVQIGGWLLWAAVMFSALLRRPRSRLRR